MFLGYNVVTSFIFTVETWKEGKPRPKPKVDKPGKSGTQNPAKRQAVPALLAGQFQDLRAGDTTNRSERKRPSSRTLISSSEDEDDGPNDSVKWGVSDVQHCRDLVKLTKCFNLGNQHFVNL